MASSNPPPVVVNMTHPNPHVAVNMSPPLKRVNMKSMFAKVPVPRSNAANVFSRNPTNTAITVKARGGKRRSTRRRRSKTSKKRRSQ